MKRKIWEMIRDGQIEGKKWFVFIDTDTYVEWDNLLALLEHFDPSKKIFIGSPVWLPKLEFAHGGSAYVLSYGALEALNKPSKELEEEGPMYSQYGVNVTALCCGDEALAVALKQKGVRLKGYWPMFNGEVPSTLAFGRELWCEPVISLHHVSGKYMEDLRGWVEDWKARTMNMSPLLFKDLFAYISPLLTATREDWENIEEAPPENTKTSYKSFEYCKAACEADKRCFQFVFHGTTCALSHTIRLGRERLPENEGDDRYFSGWNMERIREWTSKTECENAHWVQSNP
ncbi:hypothetical protein G7Y89_g15848 [Cudoniella acicularis]|uniref:N-acetylgalactosaminide beta-1,3-galactosyltransferase n=1 Tax=Cudoniella acicularis TaxID=354080 RepID=A0A8H4QFT3_9HELO|nr:hypothetical protein G7Y89_g15848 [Cudoniella acicularis]